jgi:hypothetical protein
MTHLTPSAIAIVVGVFFSASIQADEIKHKHNDAKPEVEKVARAEDSMEKLDHAMEKEKPLSFIKSEYNDFMTNVSWMNRNGFVVGAPAWKGGEDGLHCH